VSRASPLHRQLLDQARELAKKGRSSTREADLRRAVSAVYYALFHFLIDEAARYFLGSRASERDLRSIMARAFVHGEMAKASRPFMSGTLPGKFAAFHPIPGPLSAIAKAFVDIQQARHLADYDPSARFEIPQVEAIIRRAENAIIDWEQIRGEPAARFYLMSLLVWDRISTK